MSADRRLRVAIVGVGPKGLYCFERLVAHAAASGRPLRIDLYETSGEPGAGAVYGSGQPDWLRMNFADRLIDAWPESGVEPAVPAHRRESFTEWRAGRDEPEAALADGYSPRALVGRYLCDCFAAVFAALPPNVDASLHPAAVERIERVGQGGGWRLRAEGAGTAADLFDEVMLTLGHRPGAVAPPWDLGGRGVRVSYPLGDALSERAVPPGADICVRGMALTLIDVALALTEGRGGGFVAREGAGGRLSYVPAPGEVGTITAISRSGRPVLVKPDPGRLDGEPAAGLLASQGRERLFAAGIGSTADVVTELCRTAAGLHAELAPAAGADGRMIPGPESLGCWLDGLLEPAPAPEAATAARRISRSWRIAAGLRRPDVRWALGEAWRALYPALVERGGHGGITAAEWPRFAVLAREMERISFGPPPLNGAKLLALVDAGKVRFTAEGPDARARRVDAVLSAPGAVERCGDLVDDLIDAGAVRPAPGGRRGIEVGRDAGCMAADGSPSPGLAAVGRLTEDWVIGNDTLSRRLHDHPERWAARVAGAGAAA